ncbi:MAG: hypothetical protein FWC39_09255 [Bacteroidetes bacterium]|nr:hypothetical protein [Bacteroidota bacterium]
MQKYKILQKNEHFFIEIFSFSVNEHFFIEIFSFSVAEPKYQFPSFKSQTCR